MRLNAFSDVCLRAMMLLAAAPDEGLLTTQAITDGIGVPYNHVSKAVMKLRSLGLVDVTRGRSGGAVISSFGRTATVGWLLRELDEREDLVNCEAAEGSCPLIAQCRLRTALRRAREAFYRELDDLQISSLPSAQQMDPVFVSLLTRRPA